jgi:hypothetical protein
VRARPDSEEPAAGGTSAQSLPLQALADRAGAVLHLKGPQLPGFLQS